MSATSGITLERVPLHKQIVTKALLEANYSNRQIAEELDIGVNTVTAIRNKNLPESTLMESVKKVLPAAFYTLGALAISKVSPEKLDGCSAPQLMMVSGIAIDKARDMEGSNRPVFNIVTVVQEAQKTMAKLEAEMNMIGQAEARLSTQTQTVQRGDLT